MGITPQGWLLLHTQAVHIGLDFLVLTDPVLWLFLLQLKVGITILVLREAMDLVIVEPVQIEEPCHPGFARSMLKSCFHQQRLHFPGFLPLVFV